MFRPPSPTVRTTVSRRFFSPPMQVAISETVFQCESPQPPMVPPKPYKSHQIVSMSAVDDIPVLFTPPLPFTPTIERFSFPNLAPPNLLYRYPLPPMPFLSGFQLRDLPFPYGVGAATSLRLIYKNPPIQLLFVGLTFDSHPYSSGPARTYAYRRFR